MKNKSVWPAIFAVALMTGSFVSTGWSIRYLGSVWPPAGVVLLVLSLTFVFVVGLMWTGRLVAHPGYDFYGWDNGVAIALLLTASGILLLCFNAGVLPAGWKEFFFSWPMLLYVLGAIGICRFHFIGGFVITLAGVFFLIPRMTAIYPEEAFYDRFADIYWPLLIILPGLLLFIHILLHKHGHYSCRRTPWKHRKFRRWEYRCREHFRKHYRSRYSAVTQENEKGKINYQSLFGSIEQVILDSEFKGGNMDATFGSIDLNLRHTSLQDGETFLYARTVFGGIEIQVPPDWYIEVVPARIMAGGVNDARIARTAPPHPEKKLVIVAECVFGGLSIVP
ncbi:MAG: cell wall-active antibiotics response protein [Tannerella sp.]|nr:cell wall-active antibiotics response protein [Tannerella sp.]